MNLFAPEPTTTTLFKTQVRESFQGKSVHSKVEANAIAVSYIRQSAPKLKFSRGYLGTLPIQSSSPWAPADKDRKQVKH